MSQLIKTVLLPSPHGQGHEASDPGPFRGKNDGDEEEKGEEG